MQRIGIVLPKYKHVLFENIKLCYVSKAIQHPTLCPIFYIITFRWNSEIQEGIYAMLEMLVDLVTTRLERDPVPCGLLATLALVSHSYQIM
jgi:hypothetical protein